MAYYVGLDVSLKTTAICVVDRDQNIVWQGSADTHPDMILTALDRWIGSIVRIGLETGSSRRLAGAGAEGAEPAGHRDGCAPCGGRTQGPTGED